MKDIENGLRGAYVYINTKKSTSDDDQKGKDLPNLVLEIKLQFEAQGRQRAKRVSTDGC